MSADNYLAIRYKKDKGKWFVLMGNASAEEEGHPHETNWGQAGGYYDRDDALDYAQEIMKTDIVEYGINYIEPLDKEGEVQ